MSWSSLAAAAAPRLDAPEGFECPSSSVLRQTLVAQLGHDDFDREDAPNVHVQVRESEDGTLAADLSVTTTTSTTTRRIDNADSCADLVRAAALSVALAIERDASQKPPAKPPAPVAARRPVETPMHDDRVAATASVLSSIGLLPRPAIGVGLGARVRVARRFWLSGRGFWLPEASMPNDTFAMTWPPRAPAHVSSRSARVEQWPPPARTCSVARSA